VNLTRDAVLSYIPWPDTNAHTSEILGDGFKVTLHNTGVALDTGATRWMTGSSNMAVVPATGGQVPVARDYELHIVADSSVVTVNGRMSNFELWDVTDTDHPFGIGYRYTESTSKLKKGRLAAGDRFLVSSIDSLSRSWSFDIAVRSGTGAAVQPAVGDVYRIVTTKNWDRFDRYQFTILGNDVDQTREHTELSRIYTVPDPYLTVSSLERKIINADEGRGDRRIDFVNLPRRCVISIFTTAGRLVRVLEHTATENNAREAWDLRTKDGLEVSSGIYFYVVEAVGAGTFRGRLAIIK